MFFELKKYVLFRLKEQHDKELSAIRAEVGNQTVAAHQKIQQMSEFSENVLKELTLLQVKTTLKTSKGLKTTLKTSEESKTTLEASEILRTTCPRSVRGNSYLPVRQSRGFIKLVL